MKYIWDKQTVVDAIKNSDSYSETLRKMNIPISGNNSSTLKRKIKAFNIDISHFTFSKQYKSNVQNKAYISATTYLNDTVPIKTFNLKNKLIKEGIKENKCEICGISSWLDKELILQLHHINGVHTDNHLENLQLLCPNCHSQTDNFCGKAQKKKHYYCKDCHKEISRTATYCTKCRGNHSRKVQRPSKEQLVELYKEHKSLSAIGSIYKVSDVAINKWFKSYGLPRKSSELKKLLNII